MYDIDATDVLDGEELATLRREQGHRPYTTDAEALGAWLQGRAS